MDSFLSELLKQCPKIEPLNLAEKMDNMDIIYAPRVPAKSPWVYGTEKDIENVILKFLVSKLQQLVADMWFWGYEGHMDEQSEEWQMWHISNIFERMSDLGVEI